ncbi:C2 domain-containing protein, partial [Abortiporus biennis]
MSRELGTLVVVILKARNLLDRHSLYKQDAYAQASLNGKTKKTQVDVKGGQHPEWDEEVRFTVYDSKSEDARTLKVSCWSKEPRGDETVGEGKLDISETLRTGEFDDWIPLQVDGTSRGELYLEMTFYAAGPPPLSRRPSKLAPKDRL